MGDEGFSLAVYESIFGNNMKLLKNSVFVAVLSALLSTVLSIAVAFSVRFTCKKIKSILMGILLISMVSPPFIASLAYIQLFGRNGLISKGLLGLSLNPYGWVGFALYRYLMRKNDKIFAGNNNKASGAEEDFRLKGVSAVVIYGFSAIFFVTMILEYGSIFLNSFTKNMRGTLKFTTDYLHALLERNMDTFIRSVVYALIVALVGTFIGIFLSYYIERRRIRFGNFLDFIVTMPYMLQGSCFGIGYILAFNHEPLKLTGTALIVIANMIFKQMSITTKAVTASLAQISLNMDDAARDLGANKLRVFWDVLLPNLKPAFVTGFVNNFTSAMITTFIILITLLINVIFYVGFSGERGRKKRVSGIKWQRGAALSSWLFGMRENDNLKNDRRIFKAKQRRNLG